MIRRPPRSTQSRSSAASDVYKRQLCATLAWRESLIKQQLQQFHDDHADDEAAAECEDNNPWDIDPSIGVCVCVCCESPHVGLSWSCVLIHDHGKRRRQLLIQRWGTVYVSDGFVTKLLCKVTKINYDKIRPTRQNTLTRPGILDCSDVQPPDFCCRFRSNQKHYSYMFGYQQIALDELHRMAWS